MDKIIVRFCIDFADVNGLGIQWVKHYYPLKPFVFLNPGNDNCHINIAPGLTHHLQKESNI